MNKKTRNSKKKKTFQNFLIFSRIFLSILLYIDLHFYTVKIQIQY